MSVFGSPPPHLPEFGPGRGTSAYGEPRDTSEGPAAWLKREIDRGVGSRPAAPITPAFWAALRRRVEAAGPADAG